MEVNEWLLFQSANGPLQSGPYMCEGSLHVHVKALQMVT